MNSLLTALLSNPELANEFVSQSEGGSLLSRRIHLIFYHKTKLSLELINKEHLSKLLGVRLKNLTGSTTARICNVSSCCRIWMLWISRASLCVHGWSIGGYDGYDDGNICIRSSREEHPAS